MVRIRSRYKKGDAIIGDEERGLLLRNGSFMWARNDEMRVGDLPPRVTPVPMLAFAPAQTGPPGGGA